MKKQIIILLLNILFLTGISEVLAQQKISFPEAKFKTGDEISWKERELNDSGWETIKTSEIWEEQGYPVYNGYAWYRIRFNLPKALLDNSVLKKELNFYFAQIDDADEIYLNGKLIGKTGKFPTDEGGYYSQWTVIRNYRIPTSDPSILWDKENVIAIKVYDDDANGGIFNGMPYLYIPDLIDELDISHEFSTSGDKGICDVILSNTKIAGQKGKLEIKAVDTYNGVEYSNTTYNIRIDVSKKDIRRITYPVNKRVKVSLKYTDEKTKKIKEKEFIPAYILTPPIAATPRINSAKVFGVRPESPFLYKIAASGEKPIRYSVKNLPQGLYLDSITGVITGYMNTEGEYKMTLEALNKHGKAEQEFTIKVGNLLALTPPMGWNSWNCWGPSVTEAKVRSSAQALIDKGLIDYGWTYINIDDSWQSKQRSSDGILYPGPHFPNIKGLADWLHGNGLKLGIYSSPGTQTCARELASYGYEEIDARTYAQWGIDYLKYDWCSYMEIFHKEADYSLLGYAKPYQIMEKALRKQNRDIIYSLCQYGMDDVWKWGATVDGNCWRTTGDITDSWWSLSFIGFNQDKQYPYAKPGRWNDPDMLIVGKVGWGDQLRSTRLTIDEQYTHISLWALLASPLLIGCDISQLDDFTMSLLTNHEVIGINQDVLGKQAKRIYDSENIQVWVKELEDASKAIGFFNLNEEDKNVTLNWSDLSITSPSEIRDLWRHTTVDNMKTSFQSMIPGHGVLLLKIK